MNPPKQGAPYLRPENQSNWSHWLIVAVGLATVLLFIQRIDSGGLAYFPVYGNFRMATAHLAFCLPLSLWLGCRMQRNFRFPWQKLLIASLGTGLAIGSTSWLSECLHWASAGIILRWSARTTLSIILITLWSWASQLRPASQLLRVPVWQLLLLMVMPSLYLFHTEPILRENFRQSSEALRVAKALEEVQILYEIVGKVTLEKRDTQAWRSFLVRKKKELEKQCSTDLSPELPSKSAKNEPSTCFRSAETMKHGKPLTRRRRIKNCFCCELSPCAKPSNGMSCDLAASASSH